ncbi:hypothetical protein Lsan_0275 [Legionella santicrucis]|uniref:Uncharacterized protein n=1 Tax=Legionella santicrucis TaxID=45074 RepID=A0A0W0ZEX2_9GAMM|nr:hypothetical protein [Legionella santicrucis]KTD67616.1 hypothetical protein Lsan_0275 [Legionella santicrucis]
MSDIFDAIKDLETKLIEINKGSSLVINTQLFREELSEQWFVNLDLWPDHPSKSKSVATPEQLQEYSNQVLQAVFNIANASKDGYVTAITNIKMLIKSFNSLDKYTWVPKIVDNQTYQIGKALQKFLKKALSEELLSQVPQSVWMVKTVEVREPAKQLLTGLKEILGKRLTIYELHSSSEKIKENVGYLQIKNERRTLWRQQATVLSNNNSEAQQLFLNVSTTINQMLPTETDQLEEYHQKLEEMRQAMKKKLEELKVAKQEFDTFNQGWKEDNEKMKLPKMIKTSPFIRALAFNDEIEAKREWTRLFNDIKVESELYNERIGDALLADFEVGGKLLNETDFCREMILDFINEESGALYTQIKEVILLQQYIEQLKKGDVALPTIEKPSSLGGEYPAISLNIILSQEDVPSKRLAADKESYTLAIKELDAYQQQLLQQKEDLEFRYHKGNPLPSEANDSRFKGIFIEVRRNEQEKLLPQIQELGYQINAVKELIQKATLEVKGLERGLIKLNRDEALTISTRRIQETLLGLEDSQIKLSNAECADTLHYQKHFKDTSSITQTYDSHFKFMTKNMSEIQKEIEHETSSSENLIEKQKEREKFLKAAKDKLIQFKKDLDESPELYIPSAKIPKNELINCLECSSSTELMQFFDQLYTHEENANSWGGWNFTRFKDYWNHNTSFLAESDLEYDLSTTSEYIEGKIQFIEKELAGTENKPESVWIPENNLWNLQKSYETIISQKHQDESRLSQLQTEQRKLEAEKNEKLERLNTEYAPSKQLFEKAKLAHQLSQLANSQAVFALDILKLDYALTDIEEKEISFNKALKEFSQFKNEDLIAQIKDSEEELKKISDSISQAPHKEKSVNELVKHVESSILYLEKEWEKVFSFALSTVPPTEINPEQYQELQMLKRQMYASLEEKGLNATYTMLNAKITDQQMALLIIKELVEIQINSARLLDKAALIASSSSIDRNQLYEEINQFQAQIEGRMTAISEFQNVIVNEKFAATAQMLQELTRIRNILEHLEKLLKINDIYSGFVKRIEACKPDMVLVRKKLLREIEAFTNGELGTSLIEIRNNNDSTVQKELALILKMHNKIDFFSCLYAPNSLFEEMEKEEDKQNIFKQLNQVIDEYKILIQRYNELPQKAVKVKQALYIDIINFQSSELVTTLEELRNSDDSEIQGKMNRIISLESNLDEFKTNYNEKEIKKEIEFDSARSSLGAKYFGTKSIFDNYLQERANTFWFKDFLSSIAAFALGCIGYKTEAQLRQNYLDELQTSVQVYQESSCENDTKKLLQKINYGLSRFSPRNKAGEEGYDKSLHAKLSGFKKEVKFVQEKFATNEPKENKSLLGVSSF